MASVSVKSYQFPSLTLEWLDLCSCLCYVQAKQKTIVEDSGHLLCQKWPKCHWRTSQMTNWCRWQNGESKFVYSSWQKFCCAAQTDETPFLLFFLYLKINLLLFFCYMSCNLRSASDKTWSCEWVFAFRTAYIVIIFICQRDCRQTLETLWL